MNIRTAIALAALILSVALAASSGWLGDTAPERWSGAFIGIVLAIFANAIPKQLPPLADGVDPSRAQGYRRFAGWALVLAGLGQALVWLTFPLPIANYVAMALVAGALAMVIGVCVVARRQAEPPHSGAPAVARPLPPAPPPALTEVELPPTRQSIAG